MTAAKSGSMDTSADASVKTGLNKVMAAIEDIKGVDPVALDVRDITDITDYMLVVSGTSNRHIKAIYDRVFEEAKNNKMHIIGSEGDNTSGWILLDLDIIIVHIMSQAARDEYNLESLWRMKPQ